MKISKKCVLFCITLLLAFMVFPGGDGSGPQYVSAKPGPIELQQPDGSPLTIMLNGDEWGNYAQTIDGYTILQDDSGFYYYAELSAEGKLIRSFYRAANPLARTGAEIAFLEGIEKGLRYEKSLEIDAGISADNKEKDPARAKFASVAGSFPSTGTRKLLVIMVNFEDLDCIKSQADIYNFMNTGGNSLKAYYQNNSFNALNVESTVVGPYDIENIMATYGGNPPGGSDINPRLMVQEAIICAEANGVDFSQFDNDHNGYVDGVIVVHAGYGEEAGANPNCIWSHRWTLGTTYRKTYDGVIIDDYATIPELSGYSGSTLVGLGIACHEFGHLLGCPDTYDTYTPDKPYEPIAFHLYQWDVMASGSWNNNGFTPPMHNPYSKMKLGWQTPVVLDSCANVTLGKAEQNNISYMYYTSTANEFFMVENRQQIGWDAYLPGHGMLVYHIDENYINSCGSNRVNANYLHQGIDLEEADDIRSTVTFSGDPFPGSSNKTSFTDTTSPNSKSWANANTNKYLLNIAENNGTITFYFSAQMQLPAADFYGYPTTVPWPGGYVQFTDLSTNPTSWYWEFEGGTPGTSTEQNPVVYFPYYYPGCEFLGIYNIKLTVSNSCACDTETKLDYITAQQ